MDRICDVVFEPGMLYVFAPNTDLSAGGSACKLLSGVYGHRDGAGIILEICSFDMLSFRRDVRLPSVYRSVRAATPAEYRDFFFNYGWDAAVKAAETALGRLSGR